MIEPVKREKLLKLTPTLAFASSCAYFHFNG
jgi:hypothetical protein